MLPEQVHLFRRIEACSVVCALGRLVESETLYSVVAADGIDGQANLNQVQIGKPGLVKVVSSLAERPA